MKKLAYLPLFMLFTTLVSCNEFSTSAIKIESGEITQAMSDSVIMDIESMGNPVQISGKLKLIEGECVLSLKVPTGDTLFVADSLLAIDTVLQYEFIYKKSFKAPATLKLDETFDRVPGRWTFYYQVKKLDDVVPEGSFDFVMKYED